MSVRRLLPGIIALMLVPAYLFSLSKVESRRWMMRQEAETSYVLPSPILAITTLEFKGLTADFLFLKVLTFYGGTLERKARPQVKELEWRWMYDVLNASTDLDPYFFDPYYFANANLTWEAHMVKETNSLLAKGSRYRDWDYMIPFFMGFNEFYFLHENAKAAEYLMEGSKRPDAPPLMATLAVRLAYKVDRTVVAIAFLQETLNKTKDKATRKELEKRLQVLQGIHLLEEALATYMHAYGQMPRDLHELLNKRVIAQIPVDPYGGEFYLDTDGSVKTTSDLWQVQS